MKTILFFLLLSAISAISFAQVTPLKGKLSNGIVAEIINNKGELVYGTGAVLEDSMKIIYFDVQISHGDIVIAVTTGKNGLIEKEDSPIFSKCKGDKATLGNITALDRNGNKVNLPSVEFIIE